MCREETDFRLLWVPPPFHLAGGGARRLSWGHEKKIYVAPLFAHGISLFTFISYTHLILYTLLLSVKPKRQNWCFKPAARS